MNNQTSNDSNHKDDQEDLSSTRQTSSTATWNSIHSNGILTNPLILAAFFQHPGPATRETDMELQRRRLTIPPSREPRRPLQDIIADALRIIDASDSELDDIIMDIDVPPPYTPPRRRDTGRGNGMEEQ